MVVGLAMALYAAVVLWIGRGSTLFVDELDVFGNADGLHPRSLLTPKCSASP